jgi:hypothetical protein
MDTPFTSYIFPDDIISEIFKYIRTGSADCFSVKLVCKRFNRISYNIHNPCAFKGRIVDNIIERNKENEVGALLKDVRVNKTQFFLKACFLSKANAVKEVLKYNDIDFGNHGHQLFKDALLFNEREIANFVINDKRINIKADYDCMQFVCQQGWSELIGKLTETVDPSSENSLCLLIACMRNNYETVRELLKDERIDPMYPENRCLFTACRRGHDKVVHELMKHPKFDPLYPNINGYNPVRVAHENNRMRVLEELMNNEKAKEYYEIKILKKRKTKKRKMKDI